MDEEENQHQISLEIVYTNKLDEERKFKHGLTLTLSKFSMDENAHAYVLISPQNAEEIAINFIRMAFQARMNDNKPPEGFDVSRF